MKEFKKVITLNVKTAWYNADRLWMDAVRFHGRHLWMDESNVAFVVLHGVMDKDDFINMINDASFDYSWADQIEFDV